MLNQLTQAIKSLLFSKSLRRILDIIFSPITLLAAIWFRYIRSRDVSEMPLSKKLFMKIGVYPINDHYFEPLFNAEKYLKKPLHADRNLPGINFDSDAQLNLLSSFNYNEELIEFPQQSQQRLTYFYKNGSYPAGDAEILYSMVRYFKPNRLIEIGCGYSTLMIRNALQKNEETSGDQCRHVCVEPYEMDWLEELGIEIIRTKVEDLSPDFFHELTQNDILFIDSTHMIKPQGDVLFEILEILPALKKGVLVHIHDIFSPKDYPETWVKNMNRFWNEQYLVEAFLSNNRDFNILLAANYMRHHHAEALLAKCPVLSKEYNQEPGSLWLQKS